MAKITNTIKINTKISNIIKVKKITNTIKVIKKISNIYKAN
jgi:hypothetical protein